MVGPRGLLRYAGFQVSEDASRLLLTLVTWTREGSGILASLAARLREDVPELSGVAQNVNPTEGNEVFGPDWHPIWGEERIWERLGGTVLGVSAGSFLQANRGQASWVYVQSSEWLDAGPGDRVVDLYCGVGGLALNLAPRVARVVGIEMNPRAVADARASARRWGVSNAEFRCGSAEAGWEALRAEGLRTDLVTVNPPRKGMGPELATALRASEARAVLYVSCNPETLARDAAILCAGDAYRLHRVEPVDFFPHTAHVETVALFLRRN
jgi:23S rRNA (uracil1939-C5)-methyltransferase